jgi:hypothetical protein
MLFIKGIEPRCRTEWASGHKERDFLPFLPVGKGMYRHAKDFTTVSKIIFLLRTLQLID